MNSRRPKSMRKMLSVKLGWLSPLKFILGPRLSSPGPAFESAVSDAEKDTANEFPQAQNPIVPNARLMS